jgi:hypothetical protein
MVSITAGPGCVHIAFISPDILKALQDFHLNRIFQCFFYLNRVNNKKDQN